MPLNARQQCFVNEYLIDLNAAQAALRAGYSKKCVTQNGSRLLKTAKVGKAVAEAMARRIERTEISQDYVLRNLVTVLERCLQQRPVQTITGRQATDDEGNHLWTFNAAGANRALELLMRHKGMLPDKVELSGNLSLAARLSAARRRMRSDDGG